MIYKTKVAACPY